MLKRRIRSEGFSEREQDRKGQEQELNALKDNTDCLGVGCARKRHIEFIGKISQ